MGFLAHAGSVVSHPERADRRSRTGTIRAQPITTPARIAHSAHQQTLHLPRDWPFEPGLDELFRRALHDPLPAAA